MHVLTEIKDCTCGPDDSTRSVMIRFNDLPRGFLVVVDESGRPIGTVTDGDVRRAILRGHSLESTVGQVMNTNPAVSRLSNGEEIRPLLDNLFFVPVVDDEGLLREVWVAAEPVRRINTALIMAGGFGRRLGDQTKHLPKPLLRVGERPILEHILTWLEDSGVPEIYISVHYLADQIEAFIEQRANKSRITIIHEKESLGTAGSMMLLPSTLDSPVLVINGDVLTNLDFPTLDTFHDLHGYDGTLAVSPYQVSIPYGVVQQDEEGQFVGVEEKPSYTRFVASGIYVLAPEFCRLVPPHTVIDMPDLLNLGRKSGLRVGLFPLHEYWIDVGRPDDLATATRDRQGEDNPANPPKRMPDE